MEKNFRKKMAKASEAFIVGRERNAFGTRVSTRVTCSDCGREDFVAVRAKEGRSMYCRGCAQKRMKAFEPGVIIPEAQQQIICTTCNTSFLMPQSFLPKENVQCRNCFSGFFVWQGSVDRKKETESSQLQLRSSGLVLRKRGNIQ